MKKNVFVVIPSIRNLDFLEAWGNEFINCVGIVVEDHLHKEIKTPKIYFKKIYHYSWKDIDQELGKDGWIISRKNSGIRCFGFLKAYQMRADIIITLDDDCYPILSTPGVKNKETPGVDFVRQYLDNLSTQAPQQWFPTFPHPRYNYTRGFPYQVRNKYPVVISHGLWCGALDLDAKTEKKIGRPNLPAFNLPLRQFVPFGYYFPLCVMNLAFKSEITPLLYMPLMGEDNKGHKWGFDRYDDIWAGIIAKKILDHLKLSVVVGSPLVEHRKKSDILKNIIKESKGMQMNEKLFRNIQKVELKSQTIITCLSELIEKTQFPKDDYFKSLTKAINRWISIF